MATRKIVQVGDEVLRKKSLPVTVFDSKLHTLLDDMKDTVEFERGAGLAAPQIGILKRVAVVWVEEGYFELVNPQIVKQSGNQTDYEGCLSVRGKKGLVARPNYVEVNAQDRFGKGFTIQAQGFFARALCHEIDHLNGVIYTDIASCVESELE